MLQMKGVKHGDPRIKDLFHGALKPDRFRTSNVRGFCRRTVRKGSAFASGSSPDSCEGRFGGSTVRASPGDARAAIIDRCQRRILSGPGQRLRPLDPRVGSVQSAKTKLLG